jgi:3-methyladenine DNA glycosylase AlkD
MEIKEVLNNLKSNANPASREGMARFGINSDNTLGLSMPFLRKFARQIGKDHALGQELWASGIHEARILASMVDDAAKVTTTQMDKWVKDFDSWDVCDQVCMNLFAKTPHATNKAVEWSEREQEFEKRACFALIACVAWSDKKATDKELAAFLPIIERESSDERNFVKKAVNWALRQIGKRNMALNKLAIESAERIRQQGSKSARWIAADALRELTGEPVQARLSKKSG